MRNMTGQSFGGQQSIVPAERDDSHPSSRAAKRAMSYSMLFVRVTCPSRSPHDRGCGCRPRRGNFPGSRRHGLRLRNAELGVQGLPAGEDRLIVTFIFSSSQSLDIF